MCDKVVTDGLEKCDIRRGARGGSQVAQGQIQIRNKESETLVK